MMGRADLQAFTALAIVFCSIVIHLVAQPFDLKDPDHAKLHMLEFLSLSICWFTFWAGLSKCRFLSLCFGHAFTVFSPQVH